MKPNDLSKSDQAISLITSMMRWLTSTIAGPTVEEREGGSSEVLKSYLQEKNGQEVARDSLVKVAVDFFADRECANKRFLRTLWSRL